MQNISQSDKLTFLKAAERILTEFDRPMTSKEIWKEITKRKLVNWSGKSPETSSLPQMMSRHPEKFKRYDNESPMKFEIVKSNKISDDDNEVVKFTKFRDKPLQRAEQTTKTQSKVENPFKQAICVLGSAGAGKSLTTINALVSDSNHFSELLIPEDMRSSILLDFVDGELQLNFLSEMIIEAYKNPENKYTILIDEFHKPLTIRRVNDELLQAISTKRYGGVRFISSGIAYRKISKELEKIGIDKKIYDYLRNIKIPDNFGFVLLSSKPDVIVDNDDLYGRLDIVYLRESDRSKFTNVKDFDESRIHTNEDKREFKILIKSDDNDSLNDFIDKFNK